MSESKRVVQNALFHLSNDQSLGPPSIPCRREEFDTHPTSPHAGLIPTPPKTPKKPRGAPSPFRGLFHQTAIHSPTSGDFNSPTLNETADNNHVIQFFTSYLGPDQMIIYQNAKETGFLPKAPNKNKWSWKTNYILQRDVLVTITIKSNYRINALCLCAGLPLTTSCSQTSLLMAESRRCGGSRRPWKWSHFIILTL